MLRTFLTFIFIKSGDFFSGQSFAEFIVTAEILISVEFDGCWNNFE